MNETKIWISSDHHFDHKNILKYQAHTRPYSDVQEMNEGIIRQHNALVEPNDEVYFLGDFAFTGDTDKVCTWLDRMNGKKHFVFGNHDKIMRNDEIRKRFVWMKDYHELKIPGRKKMPAIVMSHYPFYSWNRMHHGALHFYGHTHGAVPTMMSGRGRDIGLDTNNCYPLNVASLIKSMTKLPTVDARNRESDR